MKNQGGHRALMSGNLLTIKTIIMSYYRTKQAYLRGTGLGVEVTDGESIEDQLRRIKETGEGIGMEKGLIYTESSEGIPPQTNIRTDKFEEMLEAHDKYTETRRTIREKKAIDAIEKKGQGEAPAGQSEEGK